MLQSKASNPQHTLTTRPWRHTSDQHTMHRWPISDNPLLPVWTNSAPSEGVRWKWGIELQEGELRELIGQISLREVNYPEGARLGIVLSPMWVGFGYGQDALRMFLTRYWWMGFRRLFSDVHPTNEIAVRTYARLGFQKIEEVWRILPEGFNYKLIPHEYRRGVQMTRYDEMLLRPEWTIEGGEVRE